VRAILPAGDEAPGLLRDDRRRLHVRKSRIRHVCACIHTQTSHGQQPISQYVSSAPCATSAKLSAALPTERSECAIFPRVTPALCVSGALSGGGRQRTGGGVAGEAEERVGFGVRDRERAI
jgi:hypothetical protein